MTDSNLITVAEISTLAPDLVLTSYDNPTLSGMISGASKQVSDYLRYSPLAETITDELKEAKITSEGDLLIWPEKIPVITLSSLALTKGSSTVTVTLTDGANNRYNIPQNARHIRFAYGDVLLTGNPSIVNLYALRGTVFYAKYTYRAGFEVSQLPFLFKQATILYLRDSISRTLNPSGATRISQGGISLEFATRKGKSDLIQDAENLLAPYRRVV
ncbi:hypothetical protein KBC89_03500 [Candidatus Woesebacteria bacterium]|nr:hypothetical protein [Candidatus Woesebacteria bacterium]